LPLKVLPIVLVEIGTERALQFHSIRPSKNFASASSLKEALRNHKIR
jgi:hypothetical protein